MMGKPNFTIGGLVGECSVYFIYTFMLQNLQDIRRAQNALSKSKNYSTVELLQGVEKPIAPLLVVYDPSIRVCLPNLAVPFEFEDIGGKKQATKVNLERVITLLPSGMGCLTLKATPEQVLEARQVIKLARVEREHPPALKETYEINAKPVRHLEMFENIIKQLVLDLGGLSGGWVDLGIQWVRGNLKQTSQSYLIVPHFQHPFIVTTVQFPYKLSTRTNATKIVEGNPKEFASLLRVLYSDFVESNFLLQYINSSANISRDSLFFLTIYVRSCLAVYLNHEKHPGTETIESVIDAVQLLRMRWHCLVILNAIITRRINEFYRISNTTNVRRRKTGTKLWLELLNEFALIRRDIAEVVEDPITYRRAAGFLEELYRRGIEEFRIKELQDGVVLKVATLDTLYNDLRERARLRELDDLEARLRRYDVDKREQV